MTKYKQTKRLFYGKWLYKIGLHIQGCAILRSSSKPDIINNLLNSGEFSHHRRDVNTIMEFVFLINDFDSTSYQLRIEGNNLDFYTNDKTALNIVKSNFGDIVRIIQMPTPGSEDTLLSDGHVVVVDKYPHNRYQFRVDLKPHKIKDKIKKSSIMDWIRQTEGKITYSESLEKWFIKTEWNWERRYVLVEDKNTLLLMSLRCPEAIGTVYKYHLADK
jgi:hypothetical protein